MRQLQIMCCSFDKLGASNGYYMIQVFALLFVSNVTSSRISVENVTKGVGKHDPDIPALQHSSTRRVRPVLQWPGAAGHHCTQPA